MLVIVSIVVAALMIDTSISKIYVFSTTTTQSLLSLRMSIYLAIGAIYVLGQYFVLGFIKSKSTEIKTKKQPYLSLIHRAVRIVQYVLTGVFIFVIFQMTLLSRYDVVMIIVATGISYLLAIVMLGLLAQRFISWFRSNRNAVVLSYGLASAILAINCALTLVNVVINLIDLPPSVYPHAGFSAPCCYPGSLNDILYSAYSTSSIICFIVTWVATALLLSHYSNRLGKVKYWLIVSIPLVYFLTQFLPLFPDLFSGFRQSNPILFSILYTLIFSWSKPAGGILFGIAFWTIARRLRQTSSVVSSYMIISAFGLVLLFTSNQATVLLGSTFPPFGLATASFVGLSSYLMLVGIYSSATSVSEDSNLRRSIRNFAIKESTLLDSIGTAQMEQDIQRRVIGFTKLYQDRMAEETGIQSSLTED
ncbi:MAG TPA: hypothetical protein DD730_16480, partial [Desulfosporosinus sp.]|nr:hypothetical protein [Desulfosporosinus sp.]